MPPAPDFRPDPARLERDVRRLAVPRHPGSAAQALADAETYIAEELAATGLSVAREPFVWKGRTFRNVVGRKAGTDLARPWVIVGAHFDSVAHSPGADDNASGVAGVLEVARLLAGSTHAATIEFVGFNLEEIQDLLLHYKVGSKFYCEALRRRGTQVAGALVLEMVGFTGPHQKVPAAVQLVKRVPQEGRFLAAVGDADSGVLLQAMETAAAGIIELVTLAVPFKGWVVPDTRRSDNARFWDAGYPALMITDTADLRNPHYHQASDTPETLNYDFLARTAEAVARCAAALAS